MEAKTVATPGELLRGARQLYGWSVEEVAVELNLLPYIIQHSKTTITTSWLDGRMWLVICAAMGNSSVSMSKVP